MKVYLNHDHLAVMKRRMREAVPNLGASARMEAIARGLGFNTYSGMRTALSAGPVTAICNEAAFVNFVQERGEFTSPRVLQRTVIRTVLEPIVEANGKLTTHGYGLPNRYPPGEQYRGELERSRAEFFDDDYCDQFELALVMLQAAEKRKSLNRDYTSYGMKHTAEQISRKHGIRTDLGDYVSNGVFIAAALYEGFDVRKIRWGDLNAFLNISTKAVKNLSTRSGIEALIGRTAAFAA